MDFQRFKSLNPPLLGAGFKIDDRNQTQKLLQQTRYVGARWGHPNRLQHNLETPTCDGDEKKIGLKLIDLIVPHKREGEIRI